MNGTLKTDNGDLLPEYDLDYSQSRPNRFSKRARAAAALADLLDEDVAAAFPTAESVNHALRSWLQTASAGSGTAGAAVGAAQTSG